MKFFFDIVSVTLVPSQGETQALQEYQNLIRGREVRPPPHTKLSLPAADLNHIFLLKEFFFANAIWLVGGGGLIPHLPGGVVQPPTTPSCKALPPPPLSAEGRTVLPHGVRLRSPGQLRDPGPDGAVPGEGAADRERRLVLRAAQEVALVPGASGVRCRIINFDVGAAENLCVLLCPPFLPKCAVFGGKQIRYQKCNFQNRVVMHFGDFLMQFVVFFHFEGIA